MKRCIQLELDKEQVIVRTLSDSSLIISLGEGFNESIHKNVIGLVYIIEEQPFTGLIEVVPSYNSVTVFYDPIIVMKAYHTKIRTSISDYIHHLLLQYVQHSSLTSSVKERLVEIPVHYGGEYGPDLKYVASYNQITPEEVITYHSEQDYLVYMLGFAPGFPYLGGINSEIITPRKETPRPSIPKGSVGIAGNQTGIYSLETPGGWQIIGRTKMELFTPNQSRPTLLRAGDLIRFVPV